MLSALWKAVQAVQRAVWVNDLTKQQQELTHFIYVSLTSGNLENCIVTRFIFLGSFSISGL